MQTEKDKEISNATIDLSSTINNVNKNIGTRSSEYKDTERNTSQKKVEDENSNIDDLVVNSIQKLVEEETTVARAFVGKDIPTESIVKSDSTEKNSLNNSQASNHTHVIPDLSKELEARKQTEQHAKATSVETSSAHENSNELKSQKDAKGKKKLTKKQKMTIGIASGVAVVVLIAIIVIVVITSNNAKKKSYNFNYNKGMEYYNEQNYSDAIPYLKKATSVDEGKKNTDLFFDLYLCYRNTNQDDQALQTLKDILDIDKNYEKAIRAIASFYYEKKNIDELNQLISTYKGTEQEQYLTDYIVNNPAPSTEAGSYNENVKLQFVAESGCKVYYTLDSSTPTEKSTLYDDVIEIKSGTTTVKAIAVNGDGLYSEVVELKYEIDYKKPDAPSISPVSGTYEAGQMISVSDIPEGATVYYTTDGTTPTEKSKEYTEPFAMAEGNTVVSAILVDKNKQVSSVTKRNYVVNKTSAKQYTYEEAVSILKTQLQNKGVLLSDGTTTSTGGSATMSLQTKTTVSGTEIYAIRFDVRTNGTVTTQGYYGVALKTGTCYQLTESGGSYTMTAL